MIKLDKDEINCLIRSVVLDLSSIFETNSKSSIDWMQNKIDRLQFYINIKKELETQ